MWWIGQVACPSCEEDPRIATFELGLVGEESDAKSERDVSLIILVRSPVKLINSGKII
jgi:hypothetical protein